MKHVRFLMVGGFLGAGKTTAIARLARHYVASGQNVGLVTNDQAYDLVDTQSLRAQGFRVGEVPGACFCCKFNDLVETVARLSGEQRPDIIIAEPVGSCTDLVATVIEPLRQLHADRYEVGPLAVLLKPEHGRKILRRQEGVGFSPKAAYIFLKQLEEADVVAVNKIDKLSRAERSELAALVRERFPDARVLAVSARTGDGFERLIGALDESPATHRRSMEVDYDVYAAGEAELGWLNCTVRLQEARGAPLEMDDLVLDLVARLRTALLEQGAEPAHLKVLAQADGETAIANLVGSAANAELSLASVIKTDALEMIVNARVAIDPVALEQIVLKTIASLAQDWRLSHTTSHMQRFRPGRPVPTYRMTSPL